MRDRDWEPGADDATVSSNTKVSELAELWFAELRGRGASPGTLKLYRGRIGRQNAVRAATGRPYPYRSEPQSKVIYAQR
jgi:hypothetical protein